MTVSAATSTSTQRLRRHLVECFQPVSSTDFLLICSSRIQTSPLNATSDDFINQLTS